jgi:hypothetical protein
MENFENYTPTENTPMNNRQINGYLLETAKWGKFLAILGYVVMGIILLVALFMMFGMSGMVKNISGGYPMILIGLLYLVIIGIYYIPVTYLYKFSVQIKEGVQSQNEGLYTSGFENLKSLFKFLGIFTIVLLGFYVVLALVTIPMAAFLK